jgi:hypothetical protein
MIWREFLYLKLDLLTLTFASSFQVKVSTLIKCAQERLAHDDFLEALTSLINYFESLTMGSLKVRVRY